MTIEETFTNLALGGSDCCGDGHGGDGGSDDTFSLLDRLLEELPEVLERFVLPTLDATDLAMLARAGREWRAMVVSCNLPRAGISASLTRSAGPSSDLPGRRRTAARGNRTRLHMPPGVGTWMC